MTWQLDRVVEIIYGLAPTINYNIYSMRLPAYSNKINMRHKAMLVKLYNDNNLSACIKYLWAVLYSYHYIPESQCHISIRGIDVLLNGIPIYITKYD